MAGPIDPSSSAATETRSGHDHAHQTSVRHRAFQHHAAGSSICGDGSSWRAPPGWRWRGVAPTGARRGAADGCQESTVTTDEPRTPLKDVTSYNNFYEFGTDKDDPASTHTR